MAHSVRVRRTMRDAEAEAMHHLSEAVLAGHAGRGATAGVWEGRVSEGTARSDAGELAAAKPGLLSGSASEGAFGTGGKG